MDDFYEEEEVNEELRRLQELTEIAHNSDGEEEEDDKLNAEVGSEPLRRVDEVVNNEEVKIPLLLANWRWTTSHAERLASAANFLRLICSVLTRVGKASESHLTEARKSRAEAGAQAFRHARLVGATVVGASRRLEAIRAAEPFAVVVEEACEVIEPTLMSVLAVNTLRKLELIGDHRQLPAFIQQCWFNFETTLPSLKTSLFERLISGTVKSQARQDKPTAHCLPFTILDEQRRMRSSIADITRPDYIDVINIIDHKHTATQRIGDVVIASCSDKVSYIITYC
jgi:hypothetical protein